jgi:G3E family GTPase
MPTATAIPVYLLTGFLGSGKTTLLRRLVHQAEFANTAVIVNEYGEIALDHVLLEKSDDTDVMVLDSGCLCCATNSALEDCLETLYYRRLRGEVPAFERVVVETSGLANPTPLINALAADVSVGRHYRFAGVVTTIDAVHGACTLASYAEAATQLAVADRVVLTKVDLVAPEALRAIEAQIAAGNPFAGLTRSSLAADADAPDVLRDLQAHDLRLRPTADEAASAADAAAARFGHLLRYGIGSHAFRIAGPVDWPQYAEWVAAMQRGLGEQLLRVKGILPFTDGQNYAIHGARHLFSPPQALDTAVPGAQLGAIVAITRNASRSDVAQAMSVLTERQATLPTPVG